jgi:hypothetical protein
MYNFAFVFIARNKNIKFTLEWSTSAQKGSRGLAPLFLTLPLDGCVWSAPRFLPLYSGKYTISIV